MAGTLKALYKVEVLKCPSFYIIFTLHTWGSDYEINDYLLANIKIIFLKNKWTRFLILLHDEKTKYN